MAKPTIFRIVPFDAKIGTTLSFEWGGLSAASNKIEVRERDASDSSDAIYTNVYASYKGRHVIPADALENGKVYKVRLRIETYAGFNSADAEPSEYSDNVIFYCFATPTFGFVDLKTPEELSAGSLTTNEINSSGIVLSVNYAQDDGEELNSWSAFLCDASHGILQQSDVLYYASKTQTTFSGLSDKTNYFVRATGTTVNGMPIDTGYIPLYTYYGLPNTFINFDAVNNELDGHVDLKSAIVALLGMSGDGSDITYVGSDELRSADLTNNYIIYGTQPDTNGAIRLDGDFTIYFKAKNVKVISRDYTGEFRYPETGIDGEPETLSEILIYNAFLILTDADTGYRYSFTLWKTEVDADLQYQVFMYCNQPEHEFGLWSEAFSAIPDGHYMYLMAQRKNNTATLKVLVKED